MRSRLTTARAWVSEANPTEQGLKLKGAYGCVRFCCRLRGESNRTRIETGRAGPLPTQPARVSEANPTEQGLKPLNRPTEVVASFGLRGESNRTRIETSLNCRSW